MLEIIFTGIGSVVFTVIWHYYQLWRKSVDKDRQLFVQYLWQIKMNSSLIDEMKQGSLFVEEACMNLHTTSPYTRRYIKFFDDDLHRQFFAYNLLIQRAYIKRGLTADQLSEFERRTNSLIQHLNSYIHFIDHYLGCFSIASFIMFFSLPPLIDYIAAKYLKAPQLSEYPQHDTPNDKPRKA